MSELLDDIKKLNFTEVMDWDRHQTNDDAIQAANMHKPLLDK